MAYGLKHFFCSAGWAWNLFDLSIVLSALIECTAELVAQDPLMAGSSSNLRILRILRMTRLTRIFRVIRALATYLAL